jgi:hypothetical protein
LAATGPRPIGRRGTLSAGSALLDIGKPTDAGIGVGAADATGSGVGKSSLSDAGDGNAAEVEPVSPGALETDARDTGIFDGTGFSGVGMLVNNGAASEAVCRVAKGSSPDF